MKNPIAFWFALILSPQSTFSQVTFQKTYEFDGNAMATCIEQTSDGGFILCGDYDTTGYESACLIRTDEEGNVLWAHLYSTTGYDDVRSVKQTSDGGFIFSGLSLSGIESVAYIVKTDANGNMLWSKTYDEGFHYWTSIEQTYDGGFIIASTVRSNNSYNRQISLIKTDTIGNVVWSKIYFTIPFVSDEFAVDIAQTSDHGYILTIQINKFNGLLKTDSNGNVEWSKYYTNGQGYEMGNFDNLALTEDGGYIFAGNSAFGILLVKTNSVGDTDWVKVYPYSGEESSVRETSDMGYIITSFVNSYLSDALLIKTDSVGNILWSRAYDLPQYSADAWSVRQTIDHGYIFTGGTGQPGVTSGKIFLVKTDSNGYSYCNETNITAIDSTMSLTITSQEYIDSTGIIVGTPIITMTSGVIDSTYCFTYTSSTPLVDEKSKVVISPNPFTQSSTIYFPSGQQFDFVLYDVFGKEVTNLKGVSGTTDIQRGNLPAGIYFYQIFSKGKDFSAGKVIAE